MEEKKVEEAILKLEKKEEEIEEQEKEILAEEREILRDIKGQGSFRSLISNPGLTRRQLGFLRSSWMRKAARHKLVFALVLTASSVLIWRGIWHGIDELPILSLPLVSLGVGVLFIWLLQHFKDPR